MTNPFADRQLAFLAGINVLVFAIAAAFAGSRFLDPYNLQSLASQIPELGLLAIGVMLAMISGNGGIDLSGIALANLAAVVAGPLAARWLPPDTSPVLYSVAFAGTALAVGALGGLLNGLLVGIVGLTPIIATLGSQLLFTGITIALTNGSGVRIDVVGPLDALGFGTVAGVPWCFALFLAIAGLIGAWLRFTPGGFRLFLLGTNSTAAVYTGVPRRRVLIAVYTVCGVLAALAAIVIAARTSSAKWDYGSSYVLIAILIAVMAGVRPEGGHGRMACLVLSATALQILSSTFNFFDISNFFRDCAWGLLLLVFLAASRIDLKPFHPAARPRDAASPTGKNPA